MTVRAVRVLRIQVVLRPRRFLSADTVRRAVAGQTELRDATGDQQPRVRRTMRRVTRDTAIRLHRGMLVNKRSLLVCVTLDAGCVRTGRKSCLFKFETTVRVVTVTALHGAFEHLVMERQVKLVFGFAVTAEA